MTHSMEVCEYGYVHSQCRCPAPDKTVFKVLCNIEEHKAEHDLQTIKNELYQLPAPIPQSPKKFVYTISFMPISGEQRTLRAFTDYPDARKWCEDHPVPEPSPNEPAKPGTGWLIINVIPLDQKD